MTIVGSHLISESATALCVKTGCSASCDGLSPRQERRSNINPPPFWKFIYGALGAVIYGALG